MGRKNGRGKAKLDFDAIPLFQDINVDPSILEKLGCTCNRDAKAGRHSCPLASMTKSQIQQYEETIAESFRLQKEKRHLQKLVDKKEAEVALLEGNRNGRVEGFAKQKEGDFKFTSGNSCCLDNIDNMCPENDCPCKHEICSRATSAGISAGISASEMSTIKYYDLRLMNEKSERMKTALRKQRDIELERLKKLEDEEKEVKARKAARNPAPSPAMGASTSKKFDLHHQSRLAAAAISHTNGSSNNHDKIHKSTDTSNYLNRDEAINAFSEAISTAQETEKHIDAILELVTRHVDDKSMKPNYLCEQLERLKTLMDTAKAQKESCALIASHCIEKCKDGHPSVLEHIRSMLDTVQNMLDESVKKRELCERLEKVARQACNDEGADAKDLSMQFQLEGKALLTKQEIAAITTDPAGEIGKQKMQDLQHFVRTCAPKEMEKALVQIKDVLSARGAMSKKDRKRFKELERAMANFKSASAKLEFELNVREPGAQAPPASTVMSTKTVDQSKGTQSSSHEFAQTINELLTEYHTQDAEEVEGLRKRLVDKEQTIATLQSKVQDAKQVKHKGAETHWPQQEPTPEYERQVKDLLAEQPVTSKSMMIREKVMAMYAQNYCPGRSVLQITRSFSTLMKIDTKAAHIDLLSFRDMRFSPDWPRLRAGWLEPFNLLTDLYISCWSMVAQEMLIFFSTDRARIIAAEAANGLIASVVLGPHPEQVDWTINCLEEVLLTSPAAKEQLQLLFGTIPKLIERGSLACHTAHEACQLADIMSSTVLTRNMHSQAPTIVYGKWLTPEKMMPSAESTLPALVRGPTRYMYANINMPETDSTHSPADITPEALGENSSKDVSLIAADLADMGFETAEKAYAVIHTQTTGLKNKGFIVPAALQAAEDKLRIRIGKPIAKIASKHTPASPARSQPQIDGPAIVRGPLPLPYSTNPILAKLQKGTPYGQWTEAKTRMRRLHRAQNINEKRVKHVIDGTAHNFYLEWIGLTLHKKAARLKRRGKSPKESLAPFRNFEKAFTKLGQSVSQDLQEILIEGKLAIDDETITPDPKGAVLDDLEAVMGIIEVQDSPFVTSDELRFRRIWISDGKEMTNEELESHLVDFMYTASVNCCEEDDRTGSDAEIYPMTAADFARCGNVPNEHLLDQADFVSDLCRDRNFEELRVALEDLSMMMSTRLALKDLDMNAFATEGANMTFDEAFKIWLPSQPPGPVSVANGSARIRADFFDGKSSRLNLDQDLDENDDRLQNAVDTILRNRAIPGNHNSSSISQAGLPSSQSKAASKQKALPEKVEASLQKVDAALHRLLSNVAEASKFMEKNGACAMSLKETTNKGQRSLEVRTAAR